jgi:hypothetical protein
MAWRANQHRKGIAWPTIVTTAEEFTWAARARVDLMLVSAHGPANARAGPALGDAKGNRVDLRTIDWRAPFTFGARTGIIWDACYTGLPVTSSQLTRLSGPNVAHIAPTGKIWLEDSKLMAENIIDQLLAPGRPPVTPTAFAAAASRAAAALAAVASQVELWRSEPGGKGSS